jgi:hypothetical protein
MFEIHHICCPKHQALTEPMVQLTCLVFALIRTGTTLRFGNWYRGKDGIPGRVSSIIHERMTDEKLFKRIISTRDDIMKVAMDAAVARRPSR